MLRLIKMNMNLVYGTFLIALVFAITFTSLLSPFDQVVIQVDSFQEQIEPIPPSNNTNQTAPIVIFHTLSGNLLPGIFAPTLF